MLMQNLGVCLIILVTGCLPHPQTQTQVGSAPSDTDTATIAATPPTPQFTQTQALFDGETLAPWELTEFGGEGNVTVVDGCIEMNAGDPLTAINLPESYELPTSNYELEFKTLKVEGTDFFGTVTFPVGESFCTMVVGGWGGTVVGLSSIDGSDASENQTRSLRKFEPGQWYTVRVRVTPEKIAGWIDQEQVIDQSIVGKEVSIRSELIPCRPLGIANFYTIARIKDIQLRTLDVERSGK